MIFIGSDHAGFELKLAIISYLQKNKIEFKDLGPENTNPVDYPDYGFKVGTAVAKDKNSLGIAICGTGIGISIAANKIKGIRAALVYDKEMAKMSRLHNNANVLCLGGRVTKVKKAIKILDVFLNTQGPTEERHLKRIQELNEVK